MYRQKRPFVEVLAGRTIQSIGRINLKFKVVTGQQLSCQGFYVVPDRFVRGRYDAILTRESAERTDVLYHGSLFRTWREELKTQYTDKMYSQLVEK